MKYADFVLYSKTSFKFKQAYSANRQIVDIKLINMLVFAIALYKPEAMKAGGGWGIRGKGPSSSRAIFFLLIFPKIRLVPDPPHLSYQDWRQQKNCCPKGPFWGCVCSLPSKQGRRPILRGTKQKHRFRSAGGVDWARAPVSFLSLATGLQCYHQR